MKTYAQLKKDLQVGKQLKVIYHATRQEQVGNIKTITKTQSNAIYTTCEKDRDGKEIRLDLPTSASLVEYENNIFTIYFVGARDLNEQELEFLRLVKQEQEKRQFDNPYFIKLSLAKQSGLEYMATDTPTKRFSAYEQKVYDSSVKGAKFISFEILED